MLQHIVNFKLIWTDLGYLYSPPDRDVMLLDKFVSRHVGVGQKPPCCDARLFVQNCHTCAAKETLLLNQHTHPPFLFPERFLHRWVPYLALFVDFWHIRSLIPTSVQYTSVNAFRVVSPWHANQAQGRNSGKGLLLLNIGASWRWVFNATPPGNSPCCESSKAGWVLGSVWEGVEKRNTTLVTLVTLLSTGVRIPNRAAPRQLLYRLGFFDPTNSFLDAINLKRIHLRL